MILLPDCDQLAFQSWFTVPFGMSKLPDQPSILDEVALSTAISPQNPEPQSLVTRYDICTALAEPAACAMDTLEKTRLAPMSPRIE